MIRERLQAIIERAIKRASQDGKLGPLTADGNISVVVETPRLPEHGDLACGVAMKMAALAKMPPSKIAETICSYIESDKKRDADDLQSVTVANPGYINFKLGRGWLKSVLAEIHKQGCDYGRAQIGKGIKVQIEYVSANPTGDLHIGHGRGAVYGSCLANLMKYAGYTVEQEFYVNDTGKQIAQLGDCAWAAYQRRLGKEVAYPESGYPEDSLAHYLDMVIEEHGKSFLDLDDSSGSAKLGAITKEIIRKHQEELLAKVRIVFDRWYSEETLHAQGKVEAVLQRFRQGGYTLEADGAFWLKAEELGDNRNRVLVTSEGLTTYLTNDSAYHLDKYERGYDLMINIWGADHHGQIPGLKAAIKALGEDPEKLEIILGQIVNLSRDGQLVRMSKRMGTVVTLEEVLDEVGADAVRYYLGESNPGNPINFDLALAKQTSRENPAFYIQYAHARCCAIFRRALEPQPNSQSEAEEPPVLTSGQWQSFQNEYKTDSEVFAKALDEDGDTFAQQKSLILRLDAFPQEIVESCQTRLPGRLARYAYELANDLQKFYETTRVITDDMAQMKARLGLVAATRQVLSNCLGILGISAPERM